MSALDKVNKDYRYSAEHEWIDSSSPAKVGLSQIAVDALGRTPPQLAAEVERAYADRMDRELAHTVWNQGGCSSWYIDSRGRNSLQWPTFTFRYREQVRVVDPEDFVLT